MTAPAKIVLTDDPLPDKLSELIELAVKDARKLDRRTYRPDSTVFHVPFPDPDGHMCSVCDAGAVIAGTLNIRTGINVAPFSFNFPISNKLEALDRARRGGYGVALEWMGVTYNPRLIRDIERSPYRMYETWEEFDKHLVHMEGVAQRLKELRY